MKQYKFNEKDLERLLNSIDKGWNSWYKGKTLEWVKSLEKEETNLEVDSKPLTLEEKFKLINLVGVSEDLV